ncbi:MAG: hypothetical protein EOP06_27735 [Proteobacteria bacterium]|nr:MAG: hypothetical protein EOP06_27735 [Pseudomonadota bacterium]
MRSHVAASLLAGFFSFLLSFYSALKYGEISAPFQTTYTGYAIIFVALVFFFVGLAYLLFAALVFWRYKENLDPKTYLVVKKFSGFTLVSGVLLLVKSQGKYWITSE